MSLAKKAEAPNRNNFSIAVDNGKSLAKKAEAPNRNETGLCPHAMGLMESASEPSADTATRPATDPATDASDDPFDDANLPDLEDPTVLAQICLFRAKREVLYGHATSACAGPGSTSD